MSVILFTKKKKLQIIPQGPNIYLCRVDMVSVLFDEMIKLSNFLLQIFKMNTEECVTVAI